MCILRLFLISSSFRSHEQREERHPNILRFSARLTTKIFGVRRLDLVENSVIPLEVLKLATDPTVRRNTVQISRLKSERSPRG